MRDKRTGAAAAQDPDSPINRALAAWDCDIPEGLKSEHVSEGIRAVKITKAKVGSEARKTARKNPAAKGPDPRAQLSVRNVWKMIKTGETSGERWRAYARQLGYSSGARMLEAFIARYGDPRPAAKPAKPRASKPKANPRDAMLYVVHVADSQGKPAYDIAKFRKRADALQYAKAYASAKSVPVVLTSRAL